MKSFLQLQAYIGGNVKDPTYEQVSSGTTGHYEAVQVKFDSKKISYKEVLNYFWKNIDPMNKEGQFSDTGSQYQTAIFYHNNKQKQIAEASIKKLKLNHEFKDVATKLIKAREFYTTEEYHQDYYTKNPIRYGLYKELSN